MMMNLMNILAEAGEAVAVTAADSTATATPNGSCRTYTSGWAANTPTLPATAYSA